ncbi:hypothetical protein [Microcoleus sp. B3-D7]|uniref:hypothetical protein n=1 Tax=Microcoleus sp. B3-D7 TaxID=2818659 RepID=UPI002FD74F78
MVIGNRLPQLVQYSSSGVWAIANLIELSEAADLLNQLKAEPKKSTTTLADVETILEILGSDDKD